jgi:glycosyltransferase involved in cell wall biosynthesis
MERLRYHAQTVPAPGLYHMGKVLLFPTKLEGLGLPLFEALASGMPVIATDAPPMNEYILQGPTGYLVPVAETVRRDDGIAIPETLIDEAGLVEAMSILAQSPDNVERMGKNARAYAEEHLRIADLGQRVSGIIEGETH